MKKKIIILTAITIGVALCAAVLPQSATVRQISELDPTHAVTAPQPIGPEPEELAIPMIIEKETVKVPEAEPIQEVTPEEPPEPAPEIEKRRDEEPKVTLETAPEVTPVQGTTDLQHGDMVYVPSFGWLESQGEGTVIYDEMMYENGNKVGIMA